MRKLCALGMISFFLISMISCAPTYEKPKIDLVWPVPPDKPRIKFVDIYWSSLDLGKEGGVAESLFGEEEIMKFIKPYGVAVDNEDRIYITDVGRVIVFDLLKKDYSFIGIDPGQGQLRVPIGIAASSDGRLFVTDIGADRVYVYQEGKFSAAIGQTGEFENPTGIGLDEQRNLLYITDSKNHQVMVYSLNDYRFLRSIGKRGDAEGDFNFPTNIAVDADGNVHVVDTGNFRVQIFDTSGNFLRSIGRLGDTPGAFARPKGIAFDSKGHLYVVDAAFQNFQIFDKEGRILLFVGEAGRGPGKFMLPAGMAIDENDKIYVIDQIPGSLQIFQFLGDG